jgi:hypothetical protein
VKIISEKLGTLSTDKQISAIMSKKIIPKEKQVWIKKEDNLCFVTHTAVKEKKSPMVMVVSPRSSESAS